MDPSKAYLSYGMVISLFSEEIKGFIAGEGFADLQLTALLQNEHTNRSHKDCLFEVCYIPPSTRANS